MKIRYFFALIACLFTISLFTQCEKENPTPIERLTQVAYYEWLGADERLLDEYSVKYDGGRLIQFGNSAYTYNVNNKVDKEVYTIHENNPDFVSGSGEPAKVSYQYTWDEAGRLSSITHTGTTGIIPPASIYSYPTSKNYSYIGNSRNLEKIEEFDNDKKLVSTTKFHYTGLVLDSIVEERITNRAIADRWSPYPVTGVSKIKSAYIKIQNTNYFKALFPSLGFIPRDMHFYWQYDVLPYVIEEFRVIEEAISGDPSSVSGYTIASKYIADSQGKLESVKSSTTRIIEGTSFGWGSVEYRLTY